MYGQLAVWGGSAVVTAARDESAGLGERCAVQGGAVYKLGA